MKCICCDQHQTPNTIGGLIYISCCDKTQILISSVRPRIRASFQEDQGVILVDQVPEYISFFLRTVVLQ